MHKYLPRLRVWRNAERMEASGSFPSDLVTDAKSCPVSDLGGLTRRQWQSRNASASCLAVGVAGALEVGRAEVVTLAGHLLHRR